MLIQATTKNEISDNLIVRRTKNQFGTKYTKAGKRFLMMNRRRISTFFSASHTRDTRVCKIFFRVQMTSFRETVARGRPVGILHESVASGFSRVFDLPMCYCSVRVQLKYRGALGRAGSSAGGALTLTFKYSSNLDANRRTPGSIRRLSSIQTG